MSGAVDPGLSPIEEAALAWTVRVGQESFTDWDALTDWLAVDPRHADCFNQMTLRDAIVAEHLHLLPSQPKMPADHHARASRAGFLSNADRSWMRLAASILVLAAAAATWTTLTRDRPSRPSAMVAFSTQPGERRELALKDGTDIVMSGATTLSIDQAGRQVALAGGRATFRVTHDQDHPFRVVIGSIQVTDVGTRFDLHRWKGTVDVAVAEGAVEVAGAGNMLRLQAGQQIRLIGDSRGNVEPVPPGEVGSWNRGAFAYDDAPIAEIADDLQRATGTRIRVAADMADTRFAGSLQISGSAEQTLRGVAPLLGVTVIRRADGWELGSPRDAVRP